MTEHQGNPMKSSFCGCVKKFPANQNKKMIIEEFAEHLAGKGLSDSTMRTYLNNYKLFDEGLEDDLTQSYVNRFLMSHPSNVSRAFLSNLFEFLEITHLKIPKLTGRKGHKKRKSLTPQDIEVLRRWLHLNKRTRYLLCFDLSYYCALRRSEVMGIKVKDFDLGAWAENPLKSCKLLIRGKGRKERYVTVKPQIMHRIVDYIAEKDKDLDDRLFAFNYKQWHDAFKDAVKDTMDYNFTPHDLRRSRATRWLQEGIDLMRVKERLGHSSVQTTQRYINLDEAKEFEIWAEE